MSIVIQKLAPLTEEMESLEVLAKKYREDEEVLKQLPR